MSKQEYTKEEVLELMAASQARVVVFWGPEPNDAPGLSSEFYGGCVGKLRVVQESSGEAGAPNVSRFRVTVNCEEYGDSPGDQRKIEVTNVYLPRDLSLVDISPSPADGKHAVLTVKGYWSPRLTRTGDKKSDEL